MARPALLLTQRLKLQGFIVSEHMALWPEALKELGGLVASGRLKYRETIADGPGERAGGLPRPAQGPQLRQAAGEAGLNWTWSRFDDLGVDNLYDALALRCRVFVLEQGPYLDPDGVDRQRWHLLGRDEAGALQAYLRVVDPGVKYAEPSIGRVITSPEVRGTGLGRRLVGEGVARCLALWPGRASASARRRTWSASMASWGFGRVGERLSRGRHPAPGDARPAEPRG